MRVRSMLAFSVLMLFFLIAALMLLRRSAEPDRHAERLLLFCAAGIQAPVEQAVADYEQYYLKTRGKPVRVDIEYGGSGTLLSRLLVERSGDLFLAGDQSFIKAGREAGLLRESVELAAMKPVIAIAAEKEGVINSLQDLLDGEFRIAIGVPDGTAVGAATMAALEDIGQRESFERKVEVMKPTVNDLATDVKIGAVDAAVIWDVTARQFGLVYVTDAALDKKSARVEIGILNSARKPAAALHFARFLAAPEHGLKHFRDHHFDVLDGDRWEDVPEITLFSGGVNRRVMEPIIEAFERREGVRVNTVYQGCGALNAQMGVIRRQDPDSGFPDAYFACDVYYFEPVGQWFEETAAVSMTRIVIVTRKDNPHDIRELEDLARPGIRAVVGHPTHCTIGGLTERLFKAKGLYDEIMKNVVEQQPSSGMLVAPVISGAADVSLAYYNDTLPEKGKLHVIELDTEYARAAQPFGTAATSRHKQLVHRLYRFIGDSREIFEEMGFGWEYGRLPDDFQITVPAGARPPRTDDGEADR